MPLMARIAARVGGMRLTATTPSPTSPHPVQETSIQALLTLANQPTLGLAFLGPHALSPIPKKSQQGSAAASQMCGRLELITCMLNVQASAGRGVDEGEGCAHGSRAYTVPYQSRLRVIAPVDAGR